MFRSCYSASQHGLGAVNHGHHSWDDPRQSGRRRAGVAVTIRNAATNAMRTVVSDGDGKLSLSECARGTYELKAELGGFADVRSVGNRSDARPGCCGRRSDQTGSDH